MSWRFITAVLLIAAGASAWGGLRLGDWLVAHGPVAPQVADKPVLSTVPVLDADGRPFVAQPPQPLVDGQLAIPQKPSAVAWEIPQQTLTAAMENSTIQVATTPITMVEAEQLASSGRQSLQGIADVGNLGLGAGSASGRQPIQPVDMPPAPPAPPAVAAASGQAWQTRLHQDLQVCAEQGFFERPSCAWAARNKYCEPNNGWGQVRDCPPKNR